MKFGHLEGVPPPSNLGPWLVPPPFPVRVTTRTTTVFAQGTLSGGISGAAKVPSSGSSLTVAQGNNGDEWPELWDRVPLPPGYP